MLSLVIISALLTFLGAVLSFAKEIFTIRSKRKEDRAMGHQKKLKKTEKSEMIFPLLALVMGVGGALLSFCSGKMNYDAKLTSDSVAVRNQFKYDSIYTHEVNLLGGGSISPQFSLFAVAPMKFQFLLVDTSRYTMHDIDINIRDDNAAELYKSKYKAESRDSIANQRNYGLYLMYGSANYEHHYSIPFLTYNNPNWVEAVNVDSTTTHLRYTVDINWTIGSLTYYFDYHKINGSWNGKVKCYNRISGITTEY